MRSIFLFDGWPYKMTAEYGSRRWLCFHDRGRRRSIEPTNAECVSSGSREVAGIHFRERYPRDGRERAHPACVRDSKIPPPRAAWLSVVSSSHIVARGPIAQHTIVALSGRAARPRGPRPFDPRLGSLLEHCQKVRQPRRTEAKPQLVRQSDVGADLRRATATPRGFDVAVAERYRQER